MTRQSYYSGPIRVISGKPDSPVPNAGADEWSVLNGSIERVGLRQVASLPHTGAKLRNGKVG
ncbi:MAG TPA: hypothetical protein VKD91_17060 [Pyrinomonadaceae bacterium]|nr:hypothetical protein [Pyrinomonadaceae bacterium]